MQTDTDTMPGMALRDHELAAERLELLGELAYVANDETAGVYGDEDPAAGVRH